MCVYVSEEDGCTLQTNDVKLLGLVNSRELVAAEAHYHRSCYRDYTKSTEKMKYI
jgi:hypothetical protein